MQSGQVFRLLLCEWQQAKQPVGMKPGLEDSPHYDVSHTVTLFKKPVHGLAVSWFYIVQGIRNIVAFQKKINWTDVY